MIITEKGKIGTLKQYADKHIANWNQNIPDSVKNTYNVLKLRDPEQAEKYLADKREAEYAKILRSTVKSKKYDLFFRSGPLKFYIDKNDPILNTPSRIRLLRDLKSSVKIFEQSIKGVVPMKSPRFILRDLTKDPMAYGASPSNKNDLAPAYYRDRIIYLDFESVEDPDYITHEYAHYIADLIPKQTEPILKREYENMLDNFFSDGKRRRSLQGARNNATRKRIAEMLGLPSAYSVTNFDEWFAEIITYWKKIPNNTQTYKFKQAVKKVITRL